MKYKYIGNNGDFLLENPEMISYLYFPIANEAGVMSCVTPNLSGDSKISQNGFFMPPVSSENLHNDKSSRNIWCKVDRKDIWSLTGCSAWQQAELFTEDKEKTELKAGFMHHTISRTSERLGLQAEIKSIVPASDFMAELMQVKIKNDSSQNKTLQIVSAIPIYGRSADNIRDHHHVTALLNRISTGDHGVTVSPTMTFDERGHQKNRQCYSVFGGNRKERPVGYYPIMEQFIGEGGSLENPAVLYETILHPDIPRQEYAGYEALGGLCFGEKVLKSGEEYVLYLLMAYGTDEAEMEKTAIALLNSQSFESIWDSTVEYWQKKVNVRYKTSSEEFNNWMRWVSFQPMLRRIYGCSFLPHHDYGRGGRGWRDLWQDCLALLIMNPDGVRQMLIDNFGGVRLDGTNATIIGTEPGEFIADRNNITRVWMDHGVWPFLTTELYIQQTGDIGILLEENSYFKDIQICRGEKRDTFWTPEDGQQQKDISKNVYTGTLLEHLLVQSLTSFYDVGEHNHNRIRGADWNDALDMAVQRGESVAFTNMYANNLDHIADLLEYLPDSSKEEIPLVKELEILLESDASLYDNVQEKQKLLRKYCEACAHEISGTRKIFTVDEIQKNLRGKANWIREHIRRTEWIDGDNECGWYNGYYDNSGKKVEGFFGQSVRMMLTSQVFSIMSGTATEEQVDKIVKAADRYLYKKSVGGYRLNTDFKEIKMDLGRMFGFAYGQKENGAVFSHMAVMYANALYSRGYSEAGFKVIDTLFEHCGDFEKSRIYPGIPEYIDAKGRGMYHYLTGAASWLLMTAVTKMFGICGDMGNLVFQPQLLSEQFDENGKAELEMIFAGKQLWIVYENKMGLGPKEYNVQSIIMNGDLYKMADRIERRDLEKLSDDCRHEIRVILA